jgi:hypothetical protein
MCLSTAISSDRCGAAESACRWSAGTAGPDGRAARRGRNGGLLCEGLLGRTHVWVERGINGTAGAVYDHREQRHRVVCGREGRAEATQGRRESGVMVPGRSRRGALLIFRVRCFACIHLLAVVPRRPLQSTVDQWVAFVDARYNTLILQLVKGIIDPYILQARAFFSSLDSVLFKYPSRSTPFS